ncbi:hypothetical protein ACFWN1_18715 [Streptomyces sp. NPDC058459]
MGHHLIVVGEVHALNLFGAEQPLLLADGRFRTAAPFPLEVSA